MRFMNVNYVKRYRMELDLRRWCCPKIVLPTGYRLVAWHESLCEVHAEVKFASFRGEIDSQVFPCLGELEGCEKLMIEIASRDGFLPEGTWLAEYKSPTSRQAEYCGTIQAVKAQKGKASIQNIGVTPFHRGQGVGSALILASLLGMHHLGVRRAGLEVTAENEAAVRLYRELGFRTARTLYKAVELAYSEAAR